MIGTKSLTFGKISGHAIMIVLSIICAFPLLWMFLNAFKPVGEIYDMTIFPRNPTLENFQQAWTGIPMLRLLTNTMVMGVLQTTAQLLTSLLAAYAFSRWSFVGDKVFYLLFAFTWLIPVQTTIVPNYVLLNQLGWLNTMQGLVVPHIASAFAVLLLFQSFKSFPRELSDAARIDGASSWGTLWRVIVPNLRSTLGALSILLFISAWNEYLWPLFVTRKLESATVQVGLQAFLTMEGDDWGALMAAATIASLPVFVIYMVLRRQVIESFLKSGLR